jgi:Ca-activated chloride channel homolog
MKRIAKQKPYLLLPALLVLTACEQGDYDTNEPESSRKHVLYALKPTQYNWPAAADSIVLANNLAAVNYYLVFDGSGSMEESGCSDSFDKIDVAKRAVSAFLQRVPTDANVGLYVFDQEGLNERVALGQADRGRLQREVMAIDAGGGTPLRSAVRAGYDALRRQAQTQLGYGEYHLVVITDGEANDGEEPDDVVDELLAESPINLHTIGFCIGEGHSLNRPGESLYRAANSPSDLEKGLDAVLAEAPEYAVDAFSTN